MPSCPSATRTSGRRTSIPATRSTRCASTRSRTRAWARRAAASSCGWGMPLARRSTARSTSAPDRGGSMRVVVTGGAGFLGRAIVRALVERGDEVVALVRDPARAAHLAGDRVTLVQSDLSDTAAMTSAMHGADGVIHAAGSYRIGIKAAEREAMRDANVGTTERVLDAAIAAS